MIPLHEQRRPRSFDDVIGQAKAIERIRTAGEPGGNAYWISGSSGTGKTTLARIIAAQVADRFYTIEYDSADQFKQAELDSMTEYMELYSLGRGGRAWIINEAHGLRSAIVRQLLGVIERLPEHVVLIFTTTRDGQAKLFEDDIDAGPLLSRCIKVALTNQGLAKAMAPKLRAGAQAVGLNGKAEVDYVKLMQRCHNNVREAWAEIQAGAMMG
ncbi:MAG: AAA family ATPase [Phycisphaerales bacterium]